MNWRLQELGFLPVRDPLTRLADPAFEAIERLGADLPRLNHDGKFRDASASYLTPTLDWDRLVPTLDDASLERLFKLFSYFASASIHAPNESPGTAVPGPGRLPAHIAIPLVRLAQAVDRPPILSYASYCLHNWRRLDPQGPVALGNIALLQNSSMPDDGKRDEDWFILVHVDIEARAGLALRSVQSMKAAIDKNDAPVIETLLESASQSLHAMNETLNRMPEQCSPDVYFRKVRPYIFGFNDVVYEGCFDNRPQTYRGETGAQSSIIPTMLVAFGIEHQNSLLTAHLEDMRKYMPAPHRKFISEQVSVRDFAGRAGPRVKELYNACLSEIIAFRSRHFEYAVNYIERKVANPIATGGTPYIPWLRQLIEETKTFYLS